jgi:hypothetical protein
MLILCGFFSVELVVSRYLFDGRTPVVVLENDEMVDEGWIAR